MHSPLPFARVGALGLPEGGHQDDAEPRGGEGWCGLVVPSYLDLFPSTLDPYVCLVTTATVAMISSYWESKADWGKPLMPLMLHALSSPFLTTDVVVDPLTVLPTRPVAPVPYQSNPT